MTGSDFRFSSLRAPLALATLSLCLGALSCASTTGSGDGAETAAGEEKPEEAGVEVQEEVPDVALCHTETQQCELTEPLPPGAGCFCPGADGAQEAGTAGG